MKLIKLVIFVFVLIVSLGISQIVLAEDKNTPAGVIPKLPQTPNDPLVVVGAILYT